MPITSVATPQMQRVRDLCDQAKSTPEGITILFRVERVGSLSKAKSLARSMQTSFCNLRVREQRRAQRLHGEKTGDLLTFARGEYDDIACSVLPLPRDEGFSVSFVPGYAWGMDLEVIDIATGKALASEDPTMNRFIVLMGKWFKEDAEARKQNRERLNPFTTEELRFMWEFDASTCEEMHVPSVESNARSDATDYASVDLATLDEDELEIVNPGDA
jgi:hypothetical protein